MMPSKEQLMPYINDRKSASNKFGVSLKTISRWMKKYEIYVPKENYGNKLNINKAREIRKKYEEGIEIKDLAKEYNVTFSTISRIVQNVTYSEIRENARVSVVYNIS